MIRPMPLLDLAFLWIDRPETPSNVGVLMLFEPAAGGTAAGLPRGNRPFAGPHTRFNEPVSAGRTYACFSLPLAGMRQAARA